MFGFVVADAGALSEEEKERYRAVYCGLCLALRDRYGQLSRACLTYDLTFFVLLCNSLHEPAETQGTSHCVMHPAPAAPRAWARSAWTDYAADLSVALAYHKVLDDVADYAAVAAQAAAAAFWNMGENCTANSRIIVPRKRKDAFTEALLAELENWRIGDPLDPENNLGSIVSEGQFRTIMGYIEKGKAEGGHVLTGGAPLAIGSGLFIPPTIFDGVTPDMTIVREEIFGPVTAILPADSDEEAVGLANATAYGLQATLFTEDVTKAHKYARALKAGTVSVNCFSEGDNTTPFGGYKLSGFGGKDKGRESHDQYTETKTIFLNLDR